MNDERLWKARETIAEADREMARLFEKRMDAVREIAAYKRENGLPVLDRTQEEAVIARGLAQIESDDLRDLYVKYIRSVMEISKEYQRSLM